MNGSQTKLKEKVNKNKPLTTIFIDFYNFQVELLNG